MILSTVAISRQNPFSACSFGSERLIFKNNYLKSDKHRPTLSAAEM